MKTSLTRSDAKIRQCFHIVAKEKVLMRGHIYEQRNVMVTEKHGVACSEQYSTIDAVLQSLPLALKFTIHFI